MPGRWASKPSGGRDEKILDFSAETTNMAVMIRRRLSMRLRRTTVGCGIQGGRCLALAVSGREGDWRIGWGLYGELGERRFAKRLSGKVWRRPLWAPPVENGAGQGVVVCGIDLSIRSRDDKAGRIGARETAAALRTQVMGRFGHASEPATLCGLNVRGPENESHLVGAVARRDVIEHEYRGWRKDMGIINPHIGSNAAALANLYLALYPAARRRELPCRMLVLEGRETTHAVLLDDWRLVDSVQHLMIENQQLDTMLDPLIQFFQDHHQLPVAPAPCVIEALGERTSDNSIEVWHPFLDSSAVVVDEATRELMEAHPDLTPLAFGMALQGG
jgi:hypothetical protein